MRFARYSSSTLLILCAMSLSLAQASSAEPASARVSGLPPASGATLLEWVLAQPQVKVRFADARTRLLRMGTDRPKGPEGSYRRATLFFRNYDEGIVHRIFVKLDTGEIAIEDLTSLVQPSREELKVAWEIIRADSKLGRLFDDPTIEPSGGFYDRSHDRGDPCAKEVCLLIEFARRRPGHGFAKQVVVNLTRNTIANPDFHTPLPAERGGRLSVPKLK